MPLFGRSQAQIDAMSKNAIMAEAQRIVHEAEQLDVRRQIQITNQIASINRLLESGSYQGEIESLHKELVERDHKLGMIRAIASDVLSQRGRMGETVFVSGLERILEVLSPKEVSDEGADAPADDA